ncbi:hypothetical protein MMC17_004023 [Xylographa soralifera]|nr:hypothetical protein [Xylographa soralifera]
MSTDPFPAELDLKYRLTSSSKYRGDKDTIEVCRRRDHESLKISFQRIRVPDNNNTSQLPPSLGTFPLFPVSAFPNELPGIITAKGGFFFPMYQREAMWINFECDHIFAIKVYVGGVNAVSGESAIEDMGTKLRRLELLTKEKSFQDYVVTPE